MEVAADIGVRTRAQILAMAKRKKCEDQSEVAMSSTLVKVKRSRCGSTKDGKSARVSTSRERSGRDLEQVRVGNLGVCSTYVLQCGDSVEEVETSTRREMTNSSEPSVDSSSVQLVSSEPNPSPAREPPAGQIEEFFARAEKDLQKQFSDKYNYDFAKDVPLEGRYEWVIIKRT